MYINSKIINYNQAGNNLTSYQKKKMSIQKHACILIIKSLIVISGWEQTKCLASNLWTDQIELIHPMDYSSVIQMK